MANQEHLDILKQGVEMWNLWREDHAGIQPDLSEADLSSANLERADLRGAKLRGANLSGANLSGAIFFSIIYVPRAFGGTIVIPNHADLRGANLSGANLSGADLRNAHLVGANLVGANLRNAHLRDANLMNAHLRDANLMNANLMNADLRGADFGQATIDSTIFGNVDLSMVEGLETVEHLGPSTIGIDTIIRSQGHIPESFLRNAGVPNSIIEAIPSIIGALKPMDYYSCFISYSSKDQDFAEQLYADLRSHNVRCWFAPEDMEIGDKIRSRIEESIRLHDKLLLVLSEYSIASNWVAYEVEWALNKEPKGVPNVLYPIRLDDAVMKSQAGWADDIRRTRHIGDFTHWKHHIDYQKAFNRLLRALKAKVEKAGE